MTRKTGICAGLLAATLAIVMTLAARANAALLMVETRRALPGDLVNVDVILVSSQGEHIAGTQNDIIFDPMDIRLEGVDECSISPAISDNAPGCDADPHSGPCKHLRTQLDDIEDGKKRFRALVLSLVNDTGIPDGVVYTCTFRVAADADRGDVIPLTCDLPQSEDPQGSPIRFCQNGSIQLAEPGFSPTVSPTTTATPQLPTTRPTATVTARATALVSSQDDGCQTTPPVSTRKSWIVVGAALIVLRLRRRLTA